jgi:hypothetical protein
MLASTYQDEARDLRESWPSRGPPPLYSPHGRDSPLRGRSVRSAGGLDGRPAAADTLGFAVAQAGPPVPFETGEFAAFLVGVGGAHVPQLWRGGRRPAGHCRCAGRTGGLRSDCGRWNHLGSMVIASALERAGGPARGV